MKKLLPYLGFIAYLLVGQTERALAQTAEFGTDQLSGLVTASTKDLFQMVVGIVNIVLYFLGGIAVLLMMYAGWLWFTSRGNSDQVKRAKGIMISAVIGLFIIFSSYAIANFVVGRLYNAVNPEGEGGSSGGGGPGYVTCLPPNTGDMYICGVSQNATTVGNNITISGWNFGDFVDVSTSQVFLVDDAGQATQADLVSCASRPYWNYKFTNDDGDRFYKIKVVVPEVPTGASYHIRVVNQAGSTTSIPSYFTAMAGTSGPTINCLVPEEGLGNSVTLVRAYGKNFGTSGTRTIFMTGWNGTAAANIDITPDMANWSDTEISFNVPANALASDVIISRDANSDKEYFQVTCNNDPANCNSGCCTRRNECRALDVCSGTSTTGVPHIGYITPTNAAPANVAARQGNLVSIHGSGFGSTRGTVIFRNNSGGAETQAVLPSTLNGACQDLWTDTDIIVAVPEIAAGSYRVYVNTITRPTNTVDFTVNTTNRPGICLANPQNGSINTQVTITGLGFRAAAGNTITYGGYPANVNDVRINADNTAVSRVPNIQAGTVGIQINDGANVSNPYLFVVNPAPAGGDPNIVSIDPVTGPAGTYMTINGLDFGNSRGTGRVVFEGTPTQDGSFSFPLQCSGSLWNNTKILVKVPTGLNNGPYNVRVVRSDGKQSNTKEFTFTAGNPKPGLCAMWPDNGPVNSPIDFYGEYFGNSGSVVFRDNRETNVRDAWADATITNVPVPANTQSGPVFVRSGGQDSNALNFNVGACVRNNDCPSAQPYCCPGNLGNYCAANCSNIRMCTYGYPFVTQPTPADELLVVDYWPKCEGSCGNAEIGVGFSTLVDDLTARNTNNYVITDITNPTSPVNIVINSITLTENANPPVGEPAAIAILNYVGNLTLNHRYNVLVRTNVVSEEGELLNNGNQDHSWDFTVSQENCRFTGVNIRPINYTATRPSQVVGYSGAPTADAGVCGVQRLRCTSCIYNWTSSNGAVAAINSGSATVSARTTSNTTPSTGTTNISCQISQGSLNASASTPLNIDYRSFLQSLVMTDRWPDCANACLNSQVGMSFNSQLDGATVTNINNSIHLANAATGQDWAVPNGVAVTLNTNSGSLININHLAFVAGDTYRVTVDANELHNIYGNTYGGTSWTFTVGSEICRVDNAHVYPSTATVAAGDSSGFRIITGSTSQSCGNVPVNCSACTYAWSTSNSAVATVPPNSTALNVIASVPGSATPLATSNIICAVTDNGTPVNNNTPAVLTVAPNNGITYGNPTIEYWSPPQSAPAQCRNMAIELRFSELMDQDSIRNNITLHRLSTGALVPVNYNFSSANKKTKVVIAPQALLEANGDYYIEWGLTPGPNGIKSAHNMPLLTFPGGIGPGRWMFTIGQDICKISYLQTDPTSDAFTCAGNTCDGDVNTSINGNQHSYSVTAYSANAVALSGTGLSYNWSVSPNSENVAIENPINQNIALVTAQTKNGRASVNIAVSGTIGGVNLGTARASIPVTVFICLNPWPSIDNFPWVESLRSLNFSTYYCQKFTESSQSLPYLLYPPVLSSNPSSELLGEYIFVVNPNNIISKANTLGPLAYYSDNHEGNSGLNIWDRALALMKIKSAHGQEGIVVPETMPGIPSNFNVTANGNDVTMTWSLKTKNLGRVYIQRQTNNSGPWQTIANFTGPFPTSYTDQDLSNNIYAYRINSCSSDASLPDPCYPESGLTLHSVSVNASSGSETNFIIFRVMKNFEHLTVQEWYKEKFPGDPLGTMTKVDGYEAMQVGNTLYISAANVSNAGGSYVYTNIYIIAYSVGANVQTKNIYDQLVANFRLNTNPGFSTTHDSNTCSNDNTKACSNNLDCMTTTDPTAYCDSRSLKIRRDVVRLTNLLTMKKYLMSYGASHKACSNNANTSCSDDSPCQPLGTCVNYYPTLNAGSFVKGQSNSKWDTSWNQTLAGDLRQTLFNDPINKFYNCDPAADPETCWNEASRTFSCNTDSYIYGYKLLNNGQDFDLYGHFEYDQVPYFMNRGFANALHNGTTNYGIASIDNIQSTLAGYCSVSPSLPGTGLCGNGRVDAAAGEECDSGYLDNICRRDTNDSIVPGLGNHNWWNEQMTGCNPPGTQEECRWYHRPLTAPMCGGYCGDNILDTRYERCEVINGVTTDMSKYSCPSGSNVTCNSSCDVMCSGTGLPAARCGDGVWTPGSEQCDATGSPNGLDGWDCNGGNVICVPPNYATIACRRACDNNGTPYVGRCGNGIVEGVANTCSNDPSVTCTSSAQCQNGGTCLTTSLEECDYGNYTTPLPANSDATHTYTCSDSCSFTNQPYCGDQIIQYSRGEYCDIDLLTPTLPSQSSVSNQYQCRMTNEYAANGSVLLSRCTPTIGGYCGNNIVENGSGGTFDAGEICDRSSAASRPTPAQSSVTNQYLCTDDCMSTYGGYCGDNNLQTQYGEQCEGGRIACRAFNSMYTAGVIDCDATTCTGGSTATCCTENGLSAKFMVDNAFELFVNGTKIGDGTQWQSCSNGDPVGNYDAGNLDDAGACEYRVNDTSIFNFNNAENVLAFTAKDYYTLNGAAGVIGTFSCQATRCRSVCYMGANAGQICSNNSDCPSGFCINPSSGMEGQSCDWNADCGGSEPTVSLCLPDNYGITTNVGGGQWHCTATTPTSENWKRPGFVENSSWVPAQSAVTTGWSGGWWQSGTDSYWNHMVPGAEPIWLGAGAPQTPGEKTIYCRYVIRRE